MLPSRAHATGHNRPQPAPMSGRLASAPSGIDNPNSGPPARNLVTPQPQLPDDKALQVSPTQSCI
ncbi:hypothetical protein C8Q76DRAFT_37601 [Earliella scabrosa]|nr:hypothetical protein C8Q76DRAFT_37601 [Earliella scabrosa]